jgi:hypothetical protein
MPTIAEVRSLAMQLPKKSRRRLGNELLDSVMDEPPGAMTGDEILAEALRRDEEIESGKVKALTHKDMMTWMQQRRASR